MPGRDPRGRGAKTFAKPALGEAALLDQWAARGLDVGDAPRAARYVRHIGYYRLSAYVRSFEQDQRDVLRPGTTFDDVLGLYVFDRKLRLLVLDAIERIEVAVRSAISDHMAMRGGAHWFEDRAQFTGEAQQRDLLDAIDRMVSEQLLRPHETVPPGSFTSALEHYILTYARPERPPTWVVFEELTFGRIRSVYHSLADRSVKASIARSLGLQPPVMSSWLLTYQRVRSICAHHGRLWNRGLGVYPALPKSSTIRWLADSDLFVREQWRAQRLYPVLVSIQTLLHTISPGSSWSSRLAALLADHPSVPLQPMGMPTDWISDPFWPRNTA